MTAADLPDDGPAQVGPVPLPRGKRVVAGFNSGQPVAWATSEPVADAGMVWLALSDLHRETGLVPILITGLDDDGTRPWDDGEFGDPADIAQLDRMNAALVLETAWSFPAWPRTARASSPALSCARCSPRWHRPGSRSCRRAGLLTSCR